MGAKNRQKILQAIQEHGKADKYEVYTGEVDSVDEDNQTCDVLIADDLIVFNVRLSVAMGSDKAFFMLPKKGSVVAIAQMDGGVDYCLVQASEIDKLWCKIGDMTFEMTKDGLVFNGGDNKGLVKVKELTDKINAVEDKVNTLIQTLMTVSVALAPAGSYPFAPIFSSVSQLVKTQQADIENDKVKH